MKRDITPRGRASVSLKGGAQTSNGGREGTGDLGEKKKEEKLQSLQVTMVMAGHDAQERAGTAVKLEQ